MKSAATGGRILLVDGFTVTAADTPENQAAYPQNPAQAEGLGFPILRCVSLISMATGLLVDLAWGPYCGKETGETTLLLQLLDRLRPGDVLVADSYYCTYWLVAACQARGVGVVMRKEKGQAMRAGPAEIGMRTQKNARRKRTGNAGRSQVACRSSSDARAEGARCGADGALPSDFGPRGGLR